MDINIGCYSRLQYQYNISISIGERETGITSSLEEVCSGKRTGGIVDRNIFVPCFTRNHAVLVFQWGTPNQFLNRSIIIVLITVLGSHWLVIIAVPIRCSHYVIYRLEFQTFLVTEIMANTVVHAFGIQKSRRFVIICFSCFFTRFYNS